MIQVYCAIIAGGGEACLLHVDQPVDRGQTDQADGGNAGVVLRRRRQRGRDDATHRAAAKNKGMNTPG